MVALLNTHSSVNLSGKEVTQLGYITTDFTSFVKAMDALFTTHINHKRLFFYTTILHH